MKKFRIFLIFFVVIACIALMFSCSNNKNNSTALDNEIVGSWKYNKVETGNVIINAAVSSQAEMLNGFVCDFKSDNTFNVRNAEMTESGIYSITDQSLVLTFKSGQELKFETKMPDKDVITLSSNLNNFIHLVDASALEQVSGVINIDLSGIEPVLTLARIR